MDCFCISVLRLSDFEAAVDLLGFSAGVNPSVHIKSIYTPASGFTIPRLDGRTCATYARQLVNTPEQGAAVHSALQRTIRFCGARPDFKELWTLLKDMARFDFGKAKVFVFQALFKRKEFSGADPSRVYNMVLALDDPVVAMAAITSLGSSVTPTALLKTTTVSETTAIVFGALKEHEKAPLLALWHPDLVNRLDEIIRTFTVVVSCSPFPATSLTTMSCP